MRPQLSALTLRQDLRSLSQAAQALDQQSPAQHSAQPQPQPQNITRTCTCASTCTCNAPRPLAAQTDRRLTADRRAKPCSTNSQLQLQLQTCGVRACFVSRMSIYSHPTRPSNPRPISHFPGHPTPTSRPTVRRPKTTDHSTHAVVVSCRSTARGGNTTHHSSSFSPWPLRIALSLSPNQTIRTCRHSRIVFVCEHQRNIPRIRRLASSEIRSAAPLLPQLPSCPLFSAIGPP